MSKCPHCQHIFRADEAHKCPSPGYIAARDRLVEAAAQADEDNWWSVNELTGELVHHER